MCHQVGSGMKVLVLPLGAIAVILAFSLWAGSYVQQQADTWEQLLDQAAAAAEEEDWPQASKLLSQAEEHWERSKTFLHTIIEHSELNEAEALFAAASEACFQQDAQEFRCQLTLLTTQLKVLAETQSVSIKNIL